MINTLITVNIYGLACSRNTDKSIFCSDSVEAGALGRHRELFWDMAAVSLMLVKAWRRPALLLAVFAIICGAFLSNLRGCPMLLDSPKTVRAGTDSLLSQKETWDRMTVIMQGR